MPGWCACVGGACLARVACVAVVWKLCVSGERGDDQLSGVFQDLSNFFNAPQLRKRSCGICKSIILKECLTTSTNTFQSDKAY